MRKLGVGSYVKLVRFVQQQDETAVVLESLTAIYGRYVGEVGQVTEAYGDHMTALFTDGEEFDVYPNEVELVEE